MYNFQSLLFLNSFQKKKKEKREWSYSVDSGYARKKKKEICWNLGPEFGGGKADFLVGK